MADPMTARNPLTRSPALRDDGAGWLVRWEGGPHGTVNNVHIKEVQR